MSEEELRRQEAGSAAVGHLNALFTLQELAARVTIDVGAREPKIGDFDLTAALVDEKVGWLEVAVMDTTRVAEV